MLIKVATIPEIDEYGYQRVVPFSRSGDGLEKYASGLPDGVQRYIDTHFKKTNGQHGVLVTAMSASEYWGSNSNGDWFFEKSLVHVPAGWTDDPETDRVLAKGWPYGYPTFYNAFPYTHHTNKDPAKAVGTIEYATWDPAMHWVLVVVSIDEEKAKKFNGGWMLDRLANGKSVPWSMGCRVPFDLSSLTPDWEHYEKAWATYDPKRHKSPADAILEYHDKVRKIAGLSRTRKEYPDELLYHMNEIFADGTKSYAINDFPSLFDLSGVGVPADQVAWTIMKLGASRCELRGVKCAGACHGNGGVCQKFVTPGAVLWDRLEAYNMSKTASTRIASLGKGGAVRKAADIDKEVVSPVSESKEISKDTGKDSADLPKDLLNRIGESFDMPTGLSTPSFMGMVLKPREFRRIVMIRMGKKDLADKLDDSDADMPFSFRSERPDNFGPESFDDGLAQMLAPFLGERSCLGPVIHRTKIIVIRARPMDGGKTVDTEPEVQEKVSALYNGYRQDLLEKMAFGARYAINPRPWLRGALYGFTSLDKVGALTGSLVPLVTERTLEYLRAL